MDRSKQRLYSITALTRTSGTGGTASPHSPAAQRL